MLERPDVPGPGEIESLEPAEDFPFLSNYELRPLEAPHVGAWMRAAEPRAGRPGAARRAHRRLGPGGLHAHGASDLRPHHRPHHPLARAAGRRARRASVGARRCSPPASARAGRGRRTASCGARTASCSPSRASSRSCATHGDRPPRARLERRRPPRAPPGGGRCAAGCRRARAGVVGGLRHGAGRRGARPARVPQRGRARVDRSGAGGAARRVQGGRAGAGAGRRGGVRHGPRPIDVDVLLLGDVVVRVRAAAAAARGGDVAAVRDGAAARGDAGRDAAGRVVGGGCVARAGPGPGGAPLGACRCGSRPENGNGSG